MPFCGTPPADTIALASHCLAEFLSVKTCSRLYASPAFPNPADPAFVNACARVETDLDARALLQRLHGVEAAFGRRRGVMNAPRTLDLDLIDDDRLVDASRPDQATDIDPGPIIPHPRLSGRAFVLKPLLDVCPDWHHPVTGIAARTLLDQLPPLDRDAVQPISSARDWCAW